MPKPWKSSRWCSGPGQQGHRQPDQPARRQGRRPTGKDGNCIRAKEADAGKQATTRATLIDVGQVGEITQIDPSLIDHLDKGAFIPASRRLALAKRARPTTSTPMSSPARSLRRCEGREAGPGRPHAQARRQGWPADHRHHPQADRRHGRATLSGGTCESRPALDAARNGQACTSSMAVSNMRSPSPEIRTHHGVGTMIKSALSNPDKAPSQQQRAFSMAHRHDERYRRSLSNLDNTLHNATHLPYTSIRRWWTDRAPPRPPAERAANHLRQDYGSAMGPPCRPDAPPPQHRPGHFRWKCTSFPTSSV